MRADALVKIVVVLELPNCSLSSKGEKIYRNGATISLCVSRYPMDSSLWKSGTMGLWSWKCGTGNRELGTGEMVKL